MKSEQWMVSQGNAQSQNPGVIVIQKGLNSSQLYIQINQGLNVLHVELYIKSENAQQHHLFASNVTNKAIFQGYVYLPQVHPVPIVIQGDHGMAEVEVIEATEAMDPDMLYMKLKCLTLQNP